MRLQDLNGNEIDLKSLGLKCLSFIPESLSPQFFEDEDEGTDGSEIIGTKISKRILYSGFFMRAMDHYDYQLLRDEIYKIFDPRKELFIIDKRLPGKRWKARNSTAFRPEYLDASEGTFDINFISPKPYAESIGTTMDPFTFDSELWQIGQGLLTDDLIYKHATNSFLIYNAGDIAIDPRKVPLIIKYKGGSTNLQIKNNTTLDIWTYTGTTATNETIEINRTRTLKNTVVPVFGDTNRKLITLAPGWNEIELTGTSGSFEITFDFRFYYV
ncbi:phage tail family protein [Bacillus sp. PAMC26568]|nr:phage tail family protein [Bacillus sp. PAMC26568]